MMLTTPTIKPFVFVLMPFASDFDDLYRFGIKQLCEEIGAYCERVDEQIFEGSILERIYNQIAKSDIIIADLTGKNPNVFYETGYAQALKKRVILLTQNAADIPFDLKHYPHIIYGGSIKSLTDALRPRIVWALEQKTNILNQREESLSYSVQGVKLEDGARVEIIEYFDEQTRSLVRVMQLDILNESARVIHDGDLEIVLVLDSYTGRSSARLQDGRYWHVITGIGGTFPNSIKPVKLYLEIPHGVDHRRLTSEGVSVSLRETTKSGRHRAINFSAQLIPRESMEFSQHFKQIELDRTIDS